MSAHSLHWRVHRIKELMEEKAQEEYSDATSNTDLLGSLTGGAPPSEAFIEVESYRSHVDVDELFQPFLDMPLPETVDDEIERITKARQDVFQAYTELVGQLTAYAASWHGDAGEHFKNWITKLNAAAAEHVTLLEHLEKVLLLYRHLLHESWKAVKRLASAIIEKLKNMDQGVSLDWNALISLGTAVAGAIAALADVPGGALVLLSQASAMTTLGQSGNGLIQGIHIGGDTVRSVMHSARNAVHDLRDGLEAKGEVIAQTLAKVQELIHDNAALVMPDPPVL
jgi:uncharacterized protein YukE